MSSYNTNLAAEFFVLSVLHRLGVDAVITLGNKKSVDIMVARDKGDALTIDVKGLAGKTNWPVDNLQEGKENHYIVFISFLGKIEDPRQLPEVFVVPSKMVVKYVYQNPAKTRKVVPRRKILEEWKGYQDNWTPITKR